MTLYAFKVVVNGRARIIGKVIQVGEKQILYRRYPAHTAIFRKWDALSFDGRLVSYIATNAAIEEIHYEHDGQLYTVSKARFLENARHGNHNEGDQWYLGMEHWTRTKRDYPVEYTKKVVTLDNPMVANN